MDAGTGEQIGTHTGTFGFTVGQRRGLRIDAPAPDGRPRYVLSLEPVSRTVTVGPQEALATASVTAGTATWCGPAPQPSRFACAGAVPRPRRGRSRDVATVDATGER